MTPRHRAISNTDVLSTAGIVFAERGLEQLRLADVAAASQLAPATLVQRFGSREGLLDALGAAFIACIATAFDLPSGPRLEALPLALHRLEARRHVAFFGARPAHGAAYSLELRKHIGFALVAAMQTGELVHCDVAEHARRLQLGYFGAVTAAMLEGSALRLDELQRIVEETLAAYR